MSGFAAIVRFDGARADTRMLARMLDAIDYRGPDGRQEWTNGQVAIGHLMLHTTTESLSETQPVTDGGENFVLAMDGWLANPTELRSDLSASGALLRNHTDAELVLRAYETWGDNCPRHVDGEYAFVIWDERRRELVCVKDHAGTRPLHYHWDTRRLLVASDMAGVLAAADFDPRPNRGMIAEQLASAFYSTDETLWQGVMRLQPAHLMRASGEGLRLQRHWVPSLEVSIRYAHDEDYQAHYRELLEDCVRRSSRTHQRIACEVSGGHDSSAIFSLAHGLSDQGRLLAPSLAGFTYNFGADTSAQTTDLPYARAVGRFLGREIQEVTPFMPPLDWFAERGQTDRDLPPYPNAAMSVAIGTAVNAAGIRVVLNGEGGDEFFGSPFSFCYAEQLFERDWRSLRLSLREDIAAFGPGQAFRMLYSGGLGFLVPSRLRELRRWLRQTIEPSGSDRQLLLPNLKQLLNERRLDAELDRALIPRNPARGSLRMTLEDGFMAYVRDFISRNCARNHYDVRSPLYARRLIEFAFGVPERQRRQGNVNKVMHLRALSRHLPAEVLARQSKAKFNASFVRQLDSARDLMLGDLSKYGSDWLDVCAFEKFYREYEGQPTESMSIYGLWTAFGIWNLFGHKTL